MSGLLTLALDSMKRTVKAIEEAGLRQGLKIVIGGGQVSENTKAYAGADAFGKDAMEAVALSKKWIIGGWNQSLSLSSIGKNVRCPLSIERCSLSGRSSDHGNRHFHTRRGDLQKTQGSVSRG